MEVAPLLKAHSHALNASLETQRANASAAREEHELAASDFASAAKYTEDTEALRILNLLQEEHQRLARIIKSQSVKPGKPTTGEEQTTTTLPGATDLLSAPSAPAQESTVSAAETPAPQSSVSAAAAAVTRKQPRDLTSSIASNLANARGLRGSSRRGLPASPTVFAQNARGTILAQPTTEPSLPAADTSKPRAVSPTVSTEPASLSDQFVTGTDATKTRNVPPAASSSATTDEPFQRFYSTFEGLLSKLSAPLAFAGLPISVDDTTAKDSIEQTSTTTSKAPQRTVKASSSEPDVTKIFSKAALRAIKEDSGFGPAESFYFVPPTGGSARYADIVSRTDRSVLLGNAIPVEGNEEFVDARESPLQPLPRSSRRYGTGSMYSVAGFGAKATSAVKGKEGKTMEELEQVNRDLKREVDQLAKTLYAWQTSAQEAQERSMALHASVRALKPSFSATLPLEKAGQSDAKAEERFRELQERLKAQQKEMERTARENEKLKSVVGRYRERWEKLKEGARVRREGGGGGGTPPPT